MTQPLGPYAHGSPYSSADAPGYPPAAAPTSASASYAPGAYHHSPGPTGGPQPAPGQPAAPQQAAPVPSRKSLRAPAILLGIGAVVLVAGVVLAFVTGSRLAAVASSLSEFRTGYEMEARLEAGTEYGLYREAHFTASQPQCQVASPDGKEVTVSSDITGNVTVNSHSLFATFSSDKAGTYTITCSLEEEETVYLGRATSVGGVFQGIGGILGGIGLATVGAATGLGGLVWLLARRRANRRSTTTGVPAPPATPYPPQAPAAGAATYTAPAVPHYAAAPGEAPQEAPSQSPQPYLPPQRGATSYEGGYSSQQQWPHA